MLGFRHAQVDDKLQRNKTSTRKIKQTVYRLQRVPWIHKNIFEVREGRMSYFVVQQTLSSRKVDFMRIDQMSHLLKH